MCVSNMQQKIRLEEEEEEQISYYVTQSDLNDHRKGTEVTKFESNSPQAAKTSEPTFVTWGINQSATWVHVLTSFTLLYRYRPKTNKIFNILC